MKLKHQSNVSKHQSMPLQQEFFDAIHVVMPQQSIPLWLMRCAKRSARKGYHRSKRMAAWGLWMNRISTDARGWGIFRVWMQWNRRIHLKSSIFMLLSFLLAKGWFVNLWQYGDPIWASLLPVFLFSVQMQRLLLIVQIHMGESLFKRPFPFRRSCPWQRMKR